MHQWMLRYGAILPKQPDLVIADLDGRGSFTLIDIKTMGPTSPTFLRCPSLVTAYIGAQTT